MLCGALALASPASADSAPVPDDVPVALMVDLSNGQRLFARETERRFVPASVVKVMTAYTAFRLIDEGGISASTPVPISQELEDEWSGEGSSMFLLAGEVPTFGELLLGATTISGNDASVALAEAALGSVEAWTDQMNINAREIGMTATHFGSANGYPDEGRTFTTASDLALLAETITRDYPELYRRYIGNRTLTWRGRTQENHDPVTGIVPGADGMKTGFTSEAGYTFLGSGERGGRRLVLVLAGVQTYEKRRDIARSVLEWGFSGVEPRQIAAAGLAFGQARVQGGNRTEVGLILEDNLVLALPRGGEAAVSGQVVYHGPLQAPIAQGSQVATLRVSIEGMAPYEVPLIAAESVEEASHWQRISNGLKGFFG